MRTIIIFLAVIIAPQILLSMALIPVSPTKARLQHKLLLTKKAKAEEVEIDYTPDTSKYSDEDRLKSYQGSLCSLIFQDNLMQKITKIIGLYWKQKNYSFDKSMLNLEEVVFDPLDESYSYYALRDCSQITTPEAVAFFLEYEKLFSLNPTQSIIEYYKRPIIKNLIIEYQTTANLELRKLIMLLAYNRKSITRTYKQRILSKEFYQSKQEYNKLSNEFHKYSGTPRFIFFISQALIRPNNGNSDYNKQEVTNLVRDYQDKRPVFAQHYKENFEALQQLLTDLKSTVGKNGKKKLNHFSCIPTIDTSCYHPKPIPHNLDGKILDCLVAKNESSLPKQLGNLKKRKTTPHAPIVDKPEKTEYPILTAAEPITPPASNYITVINNISCSIYEKDSNVKYWLFKSGDTANSLANFPLCYTEWVQQWFINPEDALKNQDYLRFASFKFKYRNQAKLFHAFPQCIDDYCQHWGKESYTPNRFNKRQQDILITIPGAIENDNHIEYGIFTWIIDSSNKQWYHRMFTPREGQKLMENYRQSGYYKVEFPSLPTPQTSILKTQ